MPPHFREVEFEKYRREMGSERSEQRLYHRMSLTRDARDKFARWLDHAYPKAMFAFIHRAHESGRPYVLSLEIYRDHLASTPTFEIDFEYNDTVNTDELFAIMVVRFRLEYKQ